MITCSPLILAPFETFLSLDRVDDVRDDRSAHRHGNPLVFAYWRLVGWATSLAIVNLTMHLLLVLELLDATLFEWIVVNIIHRAVTVTFSIFRDACMVLFSLLDHNLLFLRADMLGLDVTKLGLLLLLGGDHIGTLMIFGSILTCVLHRCL